MAGTNPNFDVTAVRTALRTAMTMGQPRNQANQVTFRWTPAKTAAGPTDPAGIPYDLASTASSPNVHPDVRVPAAVTLTAGTPIDTSAGEFDPTKLVLTILDVDYALIQGADKVLYNEILYDIEYAVSEGLFELTVWTVYCRSTVAGAHLIVGS